MKAKAVTTCANNISVSNDINCEILEVYSGDAARKSVGSNSSSSLTRGRRVRFNQAAFRHSCSKKSNQSSFSQPSVFWFNMGFRMKKRNNKKQLLLGQPTSHGMSSLTNNTLANPCDPFIPCSEHRRHVQSC